MKTNLKRPGKRAEGLPDSELRAIAERVEDAYQSGADLNELFPDVEQLLKEVKRLRAAQRINPPRAPRWKDPPLPPFPWPKGKGPRGGRKANARKGGR